MARDSRERYSDKQKRRAEHIEDDYLKKDVSEEVAERRAWAPVNKNSGGGNKSGSGRGKRDHSSSFKSGKQQS